jgi:hypothetical protein
MAEIVIPTIGLGLLYIISNQTKTKTQTQPGQQTQTYSAEGFKSMGTNPNYLPNTNTPPQNYPVTNVNELVDTVAQYPNPNIASQKYFNQNNYERLENNGIDVKNQIQNIYSLAGDYKAPSDFKHNNMIPFYGAKMKGQVYNNNLTESILDNMNGTGSQVIKKIEQAPLFKPEDNVQWAYGAPNSSDFYQSRVNPGMKASNVKPFESEYVGPGLDHGYGSKGSNGFNSGMEARDKWLDKTVDELRVVTNPKIEYTLNDHQGPSYSHVQNVGILGKVEKYHPDTYFIQNQDRWLTTTGQEKGQMLRPIEEVHSTMRMNTSCSYMGSAGPTDQVANYAPTNYEPAKRPELAPNDVGHSYAVNTGGYVDKDLLQKSYTNYASKRSLRQPDGFRSGFSGAIGAVIAPIMDIFNPTRREEYVNNIRTYGDATSSVPKDYVYNPKDVTKTTIKETTLFAPNFYINNQTEGGGYETNEQQAIGNQRDSTTCSYIGDAGGYATGWGSMNLQSAYNQYNNEMKEPSLASRTSVGNTQIFNQHMNVNIARIDSDRNNTRQWVPSNMPQLPISKELYGAMRSPIYNSDQQGCTRNCPEILSALKSNPYVHPFTKIQ